MKNTLKCIVLLMAVVVGLSMTGCETLGWANPFSPGNQIYNYGMSAWNEGNEAEAFRFFSEAIYEDSEHYPSIKFFIENYTEGLSKIDAKIAEYEASSHVDDWVKLDDLYWNLKEFYGNFPGYGDPVVLILNDQQISIPLRDLTETREGLDALAYAVGIQEGQDLLSAEDWRGANNAFDTTVDEFTADEAEDDTKLEISNYMADALEDFLSDITLEDLESAVTLLDYGMDFTETERLLILGEEIGNAGINLIFTESDRLASRGTEESLIEALQIAKTGYQYTDDRTLVDSKINTYAGTLAGIYNRKVSASERAYNGTKAGVAEVYEAYGDLNQWVNDSYPALGETEYTDIPSRIAAFNDRAISRVYAVFDRNFSSGAQNAFLSAFNNAVAGKTSEFYWFGSDAEKSQMNSWRTEYGLTHIGVDDGSGAFKEVMPYYNDGLEALDTLSRLVEAEDLGLDYFAVVSADLGRYSSEVLRTSQDKSVTYYIQDGEVKNDSSMLNTLEGMYFVNQEATMDYCSEHGINWVRDNEYTEHFAQAVTSQEVTFSITIFNVATGRRAYSYTFNTEAQKSSSRVRVDVDGINNWHFESLFGESRNPLPEAVEVTSSEITAALVNQLDFNRMATEFLR